MPGAAFIVVLSGNALAASRFALSAGDVFWTLAAKRSPAVPMTPGAMLPMGPDPAATFVPVEDVPLEMTVGAQGALLLPLTMRTLRDAAGASISFATRVDMRPLGGTASLQEFLYGTI